MGSIHYLEPVKSSLNLHTNFSNIHFNIKLPSAPWTLKLSFSMRLSDRNFGIHFSVPHLCFTFSPSYSHLFNHPNKTKGRTYIKKLFIIQFSPIFLLFPLSHIQKFLIKYSLSTLPYVLFLKVRDQVSLPYRL
jgi:hypothetical protein